MIRDACLILFGVMLGLFISMGKLSVPNAVTVAHQVLPK